MPMRIAFGRLRRGWVVASCILFGCGGGGEVIADGRAPGGGEAGQDSFTWSTLDSPAPSLQDAECNVVASNYNQTCRVDSDCVELTATWVVHFGDWCESCICPNGAINQDSVARYLADVGKTPIGSGNVRAPLCSCPNTSLPCCQGGQCSVHCSVLPDQDGGDGGASGQVLPDGSVLCGASVGPVDSGSASGPDGGTAWCVPPQRCTQFNGGWACCMSTGLAELCFPIDGG